MGEPGFNTESSLVFFVNGKKIVDNEVDPEWTLLYYLRNKLRLTGTKLGCAEGGCGACTVMVSRYDRRKKKISHIAVNACLAPISAMHGASVTTVEGIGSVKTKLHPVQERLAKAHGSQCGFCTPGIIMSMYALLRQKPLPTMHDLEIAFQGNLCRCTGYRPIIEGFKTFTKEYAESKKVGINGHNGVNGSDHVNEEERHYRNGLTNGNGKANGIEPYDIDDEDEVMDYNGKVKWIDCGKGKDCCKYSKKNLFEREKDEILYNENEFAPYDPTQEVIFPPELMLSPILDEQFLVIKGPRATWFRPTLLDDLLVLKNKFPHAKIVTGNSEVGVEVKFKNLCYPVLISPCMVPEMTRIEYLESGIKFGAAVPLDEIYRTFEHESNARPGTVERDLVLSMTHLQQLLLAEAPVLAWVLSLVPNKCHGEALLQNFQLPRTPTMKVQYPFSNPDYSQERFITKRAATSRTSTIHQTPYPQQKAICGAKHRGKYKSGAVGSKLVWWILLPETPNQDDSVEPNITDEKKKEPPPPPSPPHGLPGSMKKIQQRKRTQPQKEQTHQFWSSEYQTRIFRASMSILTLFAGKQIRNVGCLGGNIMTGSPISDMNPVLMAAGTQLYLQSTTSSRVIPMDHTFFTGYRRNCVLPNEVLVAILIPFTKRDEYFNAYKQAKRREDDIAIVNCAVRVDFIPGTNVVRDFSIAQGGMAPCTTLSLKAKAAAIGKSWDKQMLEDVYAALMEDFPLGPGAPGGMISYRRTLSLSLFFRFYLYVIEALAGKIGGVARLPPKLRSASSCLPPLELKSSQYFQVVSKEQEDFDPVGRPVVHVNAFKQATGEALYCDDIPRVEGELYVTLVTSTKSHAKILNIDASQALAVPGVHYFFCHKDLEQHLNNAGPIIHDEEIFISNKVTSQGQVIGAIVADNQLLSQRAAKMVKVDYEDLSPVIITIKQAIEANSFHGPVRKIRRGNPEEAFKEADHYLEGEVHMGGQEHFYLETQASLVIPREDDELEVICSSQNASEIQMLIAHMLNIPSSKVNVKVKRIGGGFGGKESRSMMVALPLALIAHKIRRPVRCMLDRDEDMTMTGGRHPFMGRYKVGFNKDGKIVAVITDAYCNMGFSMDLSCGVLDRALFHGENAYLFPHYEARGHLCLTNLPSNTAFRGFGGPQGMFFAENIIEEIASFLKMPPEVVRGRNLYVEGDTTHYNQQLTYCTLQRCWEECLRRSDFKKRRQEIVEFNKQHRYRKRGMSIIPTKFGIAFTVLHLNQAGALVHVYKDGSVLLSHSGIEMGQGLNTKMIQVASRALGVDPSLIYIAEMATDKVPNTSATAASSGSDLNGGAVMDACHQIVKRLEPIKAANPKGTWKEWINKAYMERIGLSAAGFYKTPEIGYDMAKNEGLAFNYYTYGAAATVVEIDCLSGDHQVLRTDIVMDLGESLNPAIDIGQVEGAFVQGLGLFTLEELVYSPSGFMFTRGPGMYKIPGFTDIPAEFNVSLLRGAPNPRAVYSSKAVGEPPLFLASSCFFAIKDAIRSARAEVGLTEDFRLDSPATSNRIRMACVDDITKKFPDPDPKSFTPWNIVP